LSKIKADLDANSNFTCFKRWIIRDNKILFEEFHKYLEKLFSISLEKIKIGQSRPDDRQSFWAGGKSEHLRAGCSITWSRGDVKESATESKPPMMNSLLNSNR